MLTDVVSIDEHVPVYNRYPAMRMNNVRKVSYEKIHAGSRMSTQFPACQRLSAQTTAERHAMHPQL